MLLEMTLATTAISSSILQQPSTNWAVVPHFLHKSPFTFPSRNTIIERRRRLRHRAIKMSDILSNIEKDVKQWELRFLWTRSRAMANCATFRRLMNALVDVNIRRSYCVKMGTNR